MNTPSTQSPSNQRETVDASDIISLQMPRRTPRDPPLQSDTDNGADKKVAENLILPIHATALAPDRVSSLQMASVLLGVIPSDVYLPYHAL